MSNVTLDQMMKSKPATPQDEIDALGAKLIEVREEIERLKVAEQAIEDAIWTRTPEEVGDVQIDGTQYSFIVSRSEKWKWDSEKIASKLVTTPLPEHIKVKYSVDKRKYQALSATDQQDLIDALTVGPSGPTVKVTKKITNP